MAEPRILITSACEPPGPDRTFNYSDVRYAKNKGRPAVADQQNVPVTMLL
jgi:hypothetical protein